MTDLEKYMRLAVNQAKISLREGNSGFGAVIVSGEEIIACAHDTESTSGDPTAHAEMTVIRSASRRFGRDLSGCLLVTTHEPCPMCSTAILWSGISRLAYGYSIREAIEQGRRRVDLSTTELFERAGKKIEIIGGVLHEECSVLYNRSIREAVRILRNSDETKLLHLARELTERRIKWFNKNRRLMESRDQDPLLAAYRIFLNKLEITEAEASIISRDSRRIVIHSTNFCPTLEACKILGLDTRWVCKILTESPTTELIRQVDPRLRFARNYDKLRPYGEFCEEMFILERTGPE